MNGNIEQQRDGVSRAENFEFSPEEVDRDYESFLRESQPVNFGKEALIFQIEAQDSPPSLKMVYARAGFDTEDDTAVKLLKVFLAGRGGREFEWQRKAFEAIEAAGIQQPQMRFARVPKPIESRGFRIDEETRAHLNAEGASLRDKAEIVVMDFVPGYDIGTIFYRWILDHAPEDKQFVADNCNPDDFRQLEKAVRTILNFERPGVGRKGVTDVDLDVQQRRIAMANSQKVYQFLRKTGFRLSSNVINMFRNTIKTLEATGIYHNDLHERNLMLVGNPASDEVEGFLIDFAKAGPHIDSTQIDYDLLSMLEQFTPERLAREEKEAVQEQKKRLDHIRQLAENPRVVQLWDKLTNTATEKNFPVQGMLGNRALVATTTEQMFSEFLGLLVRFVEKNQIKKNEAAALLSQMKASLVKEKKSGKKTVTSITNPAIYNRIDSYRELFQ